MSYKYMSFSLSTLRLSRFLIFNFGKEHIVRWLGSYIKLKKNVVWGPCFAVATVSKFDPVFRLLIYGCLATVALNEINGIFIL